MRDRRMWVGTSTVGTRKRCAGNGWQTHGREPFRDQTEHAFARNAGALAASFEDPVARGTGFRNGSGQVSLG
jgi:hypothetical protein